MTFVKISEISIDWAIEVENVDVFCVSKVKPFDLALIVKPMVENRVVICLADALACLSWVQDLPFVTE